MIYQRGRCPAVHTGRTMRSALVLDRALAPLGAPPTVSTDYVTAVMEAVSTLATPPGGGGGPWGMYLNGPSSANIPGIPAAGLGDCVPADSCHETMLHSANGGTIVVPTLQDCLGVYEAVGNYVLGNEATDQGCDETSMEAYMMSTGIAGQKTAGTAMLDPSNMDRIKWGIQIFGAVRLGMIADQQMEDQFGALEPWTTAAAANDPTAGGHDPLAVYYDAQFLYVVTWAGGGWPRGLQPVAWSLVANPAWLQEAHTSIWPDFIRAGGTAPDGFDLAELIAELPAVEAA